MELPEPVPASSWWMECFPQWKGKSDMTTPAGRPSVSASPKHVTGLMGDNEAGAQASASGGGQYSGSGEARPKIVGSNMTDVHQASTEGATVGSDQASLTPTGVQPEQTT